MANDPLQARLIEQTLEELDGWLSRPEATAILEHFATRLEHLRDQEIATALGEIAKIARLRLLDAVREDR